MLLKCVHVLVQVEQPRHEDLDLVVGQVVERRLEQRRHVLLHVQHVVGGRAEADGDPARLHQREHVRQDGRVVLQAGRVRRVRHHREDLHQDVREVGLVEALRRLRVLLEVLEHLWFPSLGKR